MNLKCLADHIVKGDYEEQMLPQEQRNKYPHKDEHIACDFNKNDDPKKTTEKRICRCLCYYNKDSHIQKCSECDFTFKKKNIGSIHIVDYEVPTLFNTKGVGGIDWLLCNDQELIATEVKPPDSTETLVRMIAEILTYKIGTAYRPAICFFKHTKDKIKLSKQCQDYIKIKDTDEFHTIVKKTKLKVLYITFDDNSFIIHDTETEPLDIERGL